MNAPCPRPLAERRADALQRLDTESQLWLATAGLSAGHHLIPMSFVWDGSALTLATFAGTRTVANLRERPKARAAIGPTHDVVIVDGAVEVIDDPAQVDAATADRFAAVSMDPRVIPGLVYLRLAPQRVLVWNGFHEFAGRTVMLDGRWLESAVD